MKKIKHYTGDSLTFYEKVRDSKRNEGLKVSLIGIQDKVKLAYENYDRAFAERQLHALETDETLTSSQRSKLSSLYKFSAAPFQKLMNELTTNEHGQADKACPFCSINSSDTFDHILPKSIFDEYAVHPLNIIPCYSECNGHKGLEWLKDDELKFLNLYQDDLPNEQYLFVELTVENGVIKTRFYVENKGHIDAGLYERIEDTYIQMKLCKRFKERCSDEITELALTIQHEAENGMADEQIKTGIKWDAAKLKEKNGYNYWKAILKEACCDDETVFKCLKTMQ